MKCIWILAAHLLVLPAALGNVLQAADLASAAQANPAKKFDKPAALLLETGWSGGAVPALRGAMPASNWWSPGERPAAN